MPQQPHRLILLGVVAVVALLGVALNLDEISALMQGTSLEQPPATQPRK